MRTRERVENVIGIRPGVSIPTGGEKRGISRRELAIRTAEVTFVAAFFAGTGWLMFEVIQENQNDPLGSVLENTDELGKGLALDVSLPLNETHTQEKKGTLAIYTQDFADGVDPKTNISDIRLFSDAQSPRDPHHNVHTIIEAASPGQTLGVQTYAQNGDVSEKTIPLPANVVSDELLHARELASQGLLPNNRIVINLQGIVVAAYQQEGSNQVALIGDPNDQSNSSLGFLVTGAKVSLVRNSFSTIASRFSQLQRT